MTERRNVELKARDADRARSLSVCEALGAEGKGELAQSDTYFKVAAGRLKLREEGAGTPHLIGYERADQAGQRESRYRIAEVADPTETKALLSKSLGVLTVVVKRRRLFLLGRVRIHLDTVEGLGDFLELEGVAPADSDLSREEAEVRALREALDISDAGLVSVSYCDLSLSLRPSHQSGAHTVRAP